MKAESALGIKSSVPGTFSNRIWEVILIIGPIVLVYFQHLNMEGGIYYLSREHTLKMERQRTKRDDKIEE